MKEIMRVALRAVFLAVLVLLPRAASATGNVPQDKALIAAYDAFRAGDKAGVERQRGKLRGHLLEYYPDFWRLRLRLTEAEPAG